MVSRSNEIYSGKYHLVRLYHMRINIVLRILIIIYLTFFSLQFTFAQEEEEQQTELEKQMEQKEKEMENFMNAFGESIVEGDEEDGKPGLPEYNSELLASIPSQTLTNEELVVYVTGLQLKLQQQTGNSKQIDAAKYLLQKYPETYHHNVALLLFTEQQYTAALYVFCSVVKNNPANTLALNNLAATLNHVGFPHKSIPVSKKVLAGVATSAMVNNNLGQSYFQLGDIDNAIHFLSASINIEPFHVEANNTMGYINEAQGNNTAAGNHYKNSLKGGYNKDAAEGLKRTNPSDDISDNIRKPPRESYPEMDDNLAFNCPINPGSDYVAIETFNARMQADEEAWSKAREEYEERAGEKMVANIMDLTRVLQPGVDIGVRLNPLFKKAQIITSKAYQSYLDDTKRTEEQFEKAKDEFDIRWKDKRALSQHMCDDVSSAECCRLEKALEDERNAEYMNLYNTYCEDIWKIAKWHYNTIAYWYPYVKNVPLAERDLVMARGLLLGTAAKLSRVQLTAHTCSDAFEPDVTSDKKASFKDIDCPVSINIPLGVGDVKVNCETLSVNMGEGIIGGMEYEFSSSQTTMYIGVGAQAELGVVSFEASATQFVTFDSDFNVTDIGNKLSAGASAMDISSTLGLNGASVQGEATFGVNSGLRVSAGASVLGQSMLAGEMQLL